MSLTRKKSSSSSVKLNDASERNKKSTIVLFTPDNLFQSSGGNDQFARFIKLRHPRTDKAALYLVDDDMTTVHEIITFDEDGSRSWFIGDNVQQDGLLHVATVIDPLYLILPYLSQTNKCRHIAYRNGEAWFYGTYQSIDRDYGIMTGAMVQVAAVDSKTYAKSRSQFMQLECILEDDDFPQTKTLVNCPSLATDLHHIASVKGCDDYQVYRYDAERTLEWLKLKVDRVVSSLREGQVKPVSSASLVPHYISTSSKYAMDSTEDEYTRYACSLIGEYLSADLSKELEDSLGISPSSNGDSPTVTSDQDPPPAKRRQVDESMTGPTEDYSRQGATFNKKAVDTKKLTVAQRQLNKVDRQGMKSLSSFFSASTSNKKNA